MQVTSPAYEQGGPIPPRFATRQVPGGGNVSIPVSWAEAPGTTRSFVLVMIDHHPVAHGWVHWLVTRIPPDVTSLPEGISGTPAVPAGVVEHGNTAGRSGYGGPQPPVGTGAHDYETTVVALDVADLGVSGSATWDDVRDAMRGHVVARASTVGTFTR
jgi:hypothetical protein